ncbi:MAG: efflux RND transporter periplasmic adaptor subunit [Desulfamplus sp.]|nr:efflux RND transporter periplasmic adaptor subunit [Desulfamplus sp.]
MRHVVEPVIGLLILLGLVGGLTWYLQEPDVEFIQGEVDAAQVNLAVKIAGRVSEVFVKEGQSVEKGASLLKLDSPEIDAKLQQAASSEKAASAQRDKAFAGARSQEVAGAMNLWIQSQEVAELAEKTYRRINNLFADGIVPGQKRDEAEAKWKVSSAASSAARSQYDMVLEGARKEDMQAATALVDKAQGAVSEVKSYLQETSLESPLAGEVIHVLAKPGEIVSPGYPLVTILDLDDIWVTFNLREDRLAGMRMGVVFPVSAPALGNGKFDVKISYVSALGDFATWRATSASGGFDLKTFEVRARPLEKIEGLRPGMSVIVPVKDLPIKDQPAKDLPTKDLPTKDLPTKDLPAKDLPAKDLPVKDLPVKDLPVKDLPDVRE